MLGSDEVRRLGGNFSISAGNDGKNISRKGAKNSHVPAFFNSLNP